MIMRHLLLGFLAWAALLRLGNADESHDAEIGRWRAERLRALTAEDGYLSLAGLYWLKEGASRFGSAENNDIVFPVHAPAHIGVVTLEDGAVSIEIDPGVLVVRADTSGRGVPVRSVRFDELEKEDPDPLELGQFLFYPIERSGRYGIRLKDRDSEILRAFRGLDSYPTDAAWRLEGTFEPFDEPRIMMVPTIIGTPGEMAWPGVVRFSIAEQEHTLAVFGDPGSPSYFTIFADQTSGGETYGAGRFLVVSVDRDSMAVVDFNKAYNPPCAFNPFATCPLPPQQNFLATRVEAGEKSYGDH